MFHPKLRNSGADGENSSRMCKWAQHFEQRRSVVVALQQQYKYIEAVVVCLWWYSVGAVAEIASQQLISIIINISPILMG